MAGIAREKASIFENFFEQDYAPLPLPMVWRVVYYEAIRGNHILWDKEDLETIASFYQAPDVRLDAVDQVAMTKFGSKFFQSSDFREMKQLIKMLPTHHKAIAFLLYRRSIGSWQTWLKKNLH